MQNTAPVVAIVVGSESDLNAFEEAGVEKTLQRCAVSHRISVISAHRNSEVLSGYTTDLVASKRDEDPLVCIGIAGMAAALPGVLSGLTHGTYPVIGVALQSSDPWATLAAILPQIYMPAGRPVLFAGVGKAGLQNACLAAIAIAAQVIPEVHNNLLDYLNELDRSKPAKVEFKVWSPEVIGDGH